MDNHVMEMKITDVRRDGGCVIEISDMEENRTGITYYPDVKRLKIKEKHGLDIFLRKNECQLRKILHTKRLDTYYKGFLLKVVISNKKDVFAFNDHNKIAVVDKLNGQNNYYTINKGLTDISRVYTDACFMQNDYQGAYAVIIKDEKSNMNLYSGKIDVRSNNLAELIAAIKGLETVADKKYIRITSDSQYVKKGLTEWIINWKLNNWYTSSGDKVKNIDYWKRFDKLTDDKYIEFEWVKGHNAHPENTLCHKYAREAVLR